MNTLPFMSYSPQMFPIAGYFPPSLPVAIDAPMDLTIKKNNTNDFIYSYQNQYSEHNESSVCLSPKSISDSDASDFYEGSGYPLGFSAALTDIKSTTKAVRPFKAFPKDPLSLGLSASIPAVCDYNSDEAYEEFREKMLARVRTSTGTNKNMRRNSQTQGLQCEDPSYREKRRKNNEAAKRSRDARKAKEDEIAVRCAFLEQENIKLKMQISSVEQENARMRMMVTKKC